MTHKNLRLCVCRVDHKCIDTDGEWDGTWDDSYEWLIYDDEGYEVAGRSGYLTEEKAREAGEKALTKLKEMK